MFRYYSIMRPVFLGGFPKEISVFLLTPGTQVLSYVRNQKSHNRLQIGGT